MRLRGVLNYPLINGDVPKAKYYIELSYSENRVNLTDRLHRAVTSAARLVHRAFALHSDSYESAGAFGFLLRPSP